MTFSCTNFDLVTSGALFITLLVNLYISHRNLKEYGEWKQMMGELHERREHLAQIMKHLQDQGHV